jgi:hypothetical protein
MKLKSFKRYKLVSSKTLKAKHFFFQLIFIDYHYITHEPKVIFLRRLFVSTSTLFLLRSALKIDPKIVPAISMVGKACCDGLIGGLEPIKTSIHLKTKEHM